ncbi:MAG: cation transporter [Nanoarchaeota archaeon]|nr:cation transporter [Nanoarchaeota archaeon]
MEEQEKVTSRGVFLNVFLFLIKLTAGIFSGSLAVMSDAFNSLTDIISYSAIHFAVKESDRKADEGHPFGHHRAEPIAGLVVAIFAGILSFEIIKSAASGLFNPRTIAFETFAVIVLMVTMVTKFFMSRYFLKKGEELDRPAIRAAGIDSRNDVFMSSIALFGVIGQRLGVPVLDSIAAIVIAGFVFYSGYRLGVENIDYLMGKAPPKEKVDEMKKLALRIKGVRGLNDVRAHYVGNYIHVEIHVEVDKHLDTKTSHDIGKQVQYAVEKLKHVDKAFIHIDPV